MSTAAVSPTVSSKDTSILEIAHAARFLDKGNTQPEGYSLPWEDKGGYDGMLRGFLGVTLEQVSRLFGAGKIQVTKEQFVGWIQENAKVSALESTAIATFNCSVYGYNHDDDTRARILEEAELPSDLPIRDAATLNDLEDWAARKQASEAGGGE